MEARIPPTLLWPFRFTKPAAAASIYNAMPPEGVDKLVEFMREFESRNG